MATAIAFFNNKGGVGKTTLACNFASHLAVEHGLRVVVVDADPQANATQLLLEDAQWEAIYEDRRAAEERTLLRSLRQIRAGDSTVQGGLELHVSPRFGVDVVAGHPSLSTVEDLLSRSWADLRAGDLGGARRSNWVRELVKVISPEPEVVIFDLGPSLGALNRSVLVGCDYFVTPVAADLFSLYALENIGEWVASWLGDYDDAIHRMSEHSDVASWGVQRELPIGRGWAGYSVQQYLAKSLGGGSIRGVKSYERYNAQIPQRAEVLNRFASPNVSTLSLGVVPNMFSMIPLAQSAHSPIADLKPVDGVRGAQVSQRIRYLAQLQQVFARLAENVGLE